MAGKEGEQPVTEKIPTISASFDRIWNLRGEGNQAVTTIGTIDLMRITTKDASQKIVPSSIRLFFEKPFNYPKLGFSLTGCNIDKEDGITSLGFREHEEYVHINDSLSNIFPWLQKDILKRAQEGLLSSLADYLEKAAVNSNVNSQQV